MSKDKIIISEDQNSLDSRHKSCVFIVTIGYEGCDRCDVFDECQNESLPCVPTKRNDERNGYFKLI